LHESSLNLLIFVKMMDGESLEMDTDLNDIEKIQVVLASSSRQLNKDDTTANSEFPPRCN